MQNNYLLMFMSSMRWVALRLELMTNLVTLVVALFLVFGLSSAPYSYKAMALSLVLQVRDGPSDSRGAGRRLVDRGRALSATPLPQRDPDSSAPARRQLRPSALQGPATPSATRAPCWLGQP